MLAGNRISLRERSNLQNLASAPTPSRPPLNETTDGELPAVPPKKGRELRRRRGDCAARGDLGAGVWEVGVRQRTDQRDCALVWVHRGHTGRNHRRGDDASADE